MEFSVNQLMTMGYAINYFGSCQQVDMAIEEMSELTKELLKHRRFNDNRCKIVEEMADVYIMLYQLQMIFSIDEIELGIEGEYKLQRLHERMNNNG